MTRSHQRVIPSSALILSVVGLATSVYLTVAHYTTPGVLACSGQGLVNCTRVTTSQQSVILGIPVAVVGLAYYVVMGGLNLPAAWRSGSEAIRLIRLALAVAGMAFILWLIYAELFLIRAICLYCTVIHVVTFLLFALLLYDATGTREP